MALIFEWDDEKAKKNQRKHKVNFEEAKTVFGDPLLVSFPDEYHSDEEQRLVSIGASSQNKILLVAHTEILEKGDTIVVRLISARKATASELRVYEEN
jgi:uncharacterized DUF497 family protein